MKKTKKLTIESIEKEFSEKFIIPKGYLENPEDDKKMAGRFWLRPTLPKEVKSFYHKKIKLIRKEYKRLVNENIIGKNEEILSKDTNSVNWRNARNNLRYEQRLELKKTMK